MADNERLAAKIEQLEAEAKKNSGTSAKPPSRVPAAERAAQAKYRAERRAKAAGGKARKPGKQPGAAGKTLEMTDDPDGVRVRVQLDRYNTYALPVKTSPYTPCSVTSTACSSRDRADQNAPACPPPQRAPTWDRVHRTRTTRMWPHGWLSIPALTYISFRPALDG